MTSIKADRDLGFAPELDQPVPYMQRTRDWYLALGYGNPYVWAHYVDVPFTPLTRPLAETRLTFITTAAPYQPDKGPQGPGAPYNSAAKFYTVYSGATDRDHDLRIAHVGIDRIHTSMEDARCWFPLESLRAAVAAGRIGGLTRRFHGAPTNRSQQHTLDVDCPEILARCREDGAEAAVLVPNCPVCHQTLCLVARHLEANGIPTVVLGCAKDIVEYCGVPRFLFSDFPLGNACGRPHDPTSQAETLERGLGVLESAIGPRTTVQSPLRWSDDPDWKGDYCNIERRSPEEVAALRAEAEQARIVARELRAKELKAGGTA
ncbi:MAG: glycine reductase [Rhodospirillales bacterium CG15_BIG_FIL_POST_REV_8_21_14_020_66_15]|nr:MAG: glycine reductase [Rhodospirillales bacterium CG15_BIG_FIL_POST_REV_8_21_14_020_66_15]